MAQDLGMETEQLLVLVNGRHFVNIHRLIISNRLTAIQGTDLCKTISYFRMYKCLITVLLPFIVVSIYDAFHPVL